MVRPLCPLANPFCGCFCLGSCPFCVSGLLFFVLTKRKSGWGICGSSCWFVCFLVCCDLPAIPDLFGLCTNDVLTAYTHVRTEPQCDIGQTRGKKNHPDALGFVHVRSQSLCHDCGGQAYSPLGGTLGRPF